MQEQQGYGGYTGNQSNQPYQPYYDGPQQAQATPTPSQSDMYDDAFIDSLSLRLSQRMAQGPVGKVKVKTNVRTPGRASAGQKLALAIVSLCLFMVIVIALVQSSTVTAFLAVVGIGIAGLVFIIVNAIFDNLA